MRSSDSVAARVKRKLPETRPRILTTANPAVRSRSRGREKHRRRRVLSPTATRRASPMRKRRSKSPTRGKRLARTRVCHPESVARWKSMNVDTRMQYLETLSDELLAKMAECLGARSGDVVADSSTSDEDADDGDMPSGRSATLNRRSSQRVRHMVEGIIAGELGADLSLLEQRSLSKKALNRYRNRFQNFLGWARDRPMSTPTEMDSCLTEFLNHKYLEGHQSYLGSDLLASLMVFRLEYRPMDRTIPRALRSMKGWRKLCPGRSKRPWPWAVWCGISTIMAQTSPVMAFAVLLGVDMYLRVSELVGAKCGDLLAPTTEGVQH